MSVLLRTFWNFCKKYIKYLEILKQDHAEFKNVEPSVKKTAGEKIMKLFSENCVAKFLANIQYKTPRHCLAVSWQHRNVCNYYYFFLGHRKDSQFNKEKKTKSHGIGQRICVLLKILKRKYWQKLYMLLMTIYALFCNYTQWIFI